MRKLKVKKPNRHRSAQLISIRVGGRPGTTAFVDQTYAWLDEVKRDFRQQMGDELPGNGVLFASDVLVELHGDDASWDRFDVAVFEAWVRAHAPAFVAVLVSMLADLAAFTTFQASRGRMRVEQAQATGERALTLAAEGDPVMGAAATRMRRSLRTSAN